MPDTNILVDSLPSLQTVAGAGEWAVRVPTTVVCELEGLARSLDKAGAALAWLRTTPPPPNTRCVTSKGTVLASFSLAAEEDTSDGQVTSQVTRNDRH